MTAEPRQPRAAAPVRRAVHVRCSAEDAFRHFTVGIGRWWPLETYGVYLDKAAGVDFTDGLLVERSADGKTSTWGEVTAWDPPRRLAFTWHPGGEPDDATSVTVDFFPDEDGTRVELTHTGWETYGDKAADIRGAYDAPEGWASVLDRYRAAL